MITDTVYDFGFTDTVYDMTHLNHMTNPKPYDAVYDMTHFGFTDTVYDMTQ